MAMKKIVMMIACAVLLMTAVAAKAQIYNNARFDNDILTNNDFGDVMYQGQEKQFSGVLSHLDVGLNVSGGLTGQIVRPFDNGGYSYQNAALGGINFPDSDPTNQIPLGSGLCLLIGVVLFAAARAVRVLLQKEIM